MDKNDHMEAFTSRVKSLLKKKNDVACISQEELEVVGLTGVQLRNYQLHGVQWMYQCFVNRHGCILGDEMGLGKTVQVISFLLYVKSTGALKKPCIIICPLSVLGNWQTEFERFAPSFTFLCFTGDKERRAQLKQNFPNKDPFNSDQLHIILTTYEICMKEASFLKTFSWEVLVVDEAHRLKNHQSLLHQELTQFDHKTSVLLTGTPIQNKLSELYSLLSFVVPNTFEISNIDQFVAAFSDVTTSSQESSKLQQLLQPFLLRRVKSEVNLDLPKKSEVVLFTGMSDLQKKYYKALLLKDYGAFSDEGGNRTRLLNILMQLRKCANHPYLFDGVEPEPFTLGEHLVEASGKLQVIDHLLSFLKKRNHKVLLFSQMVTMLDIIQDYLGLRGYSYERLDGSVRGEERYLAIKNFNETEETFIFLLSTRAGGVGLNLVSADTVIFVDSDFNPQNDLQAAARAHRIGQTREVRIIRLLARGTVDEIFFKRAQEKLRLTNAVVEGGKFSHGSGQVTSSKAELIEILKFGFDKLSESDQSELTDEDLVRSLGRTKNGEWITTQESGDIAADEEEDQVSHGNMYVYEGRDYSRETTEDDKKAFDKCLADLRNLETSERGSRRKGQPLAVSLPGETRKRKEFTPEELAERRRKREEAVARRASLKAEEEKRKAEERKQKLEKMWSDNDYISLSVSLKEEPDEDETEIDIDIDIEAEGEEEGKEIRYVIGDVTRPQKAGEQDAIIVHCVDDSGKWGSGGLFTAMSLRSSKAENKYELAGRMSDLKLGDAHLIPLGRRGTGGEANDFVALIIAQTRDRRQGISPINLTALSEGLKKVHQVATEMKASVHLPRIGYATPSFNWYGTERLIKKHLASKKTPTFIYYFPRKRSISMPTTSEETQSTSKNLGENQRKRKTPSLPNVFSEIKVYFHGIPEDEKRKLSRYIIAYDGEVDKYLTSSTTHVVCTVGSSESVSDLSLTNQAIVYKTWIDECLRRGRLVDCGGYLVAK